MEEIEYNQAPEGHFEGLNDHGERLVVSPEIFEFIKIGQQAREENLKFSQALESLFQGRRVTRDAWAGQLWIDQVAQVGMTYKDNRSEELMELQPALGMRAPGGKFFLGWVPTSEDIFAKDWRVIPGEKE